MRSAPLNHWMLSTLEQLKSCPNDQSILAEKIPRKEWARVGIDGEDVVLLLPKVTGSPPRDIVLAQLTVQFNVECSVQHGAKTLDETLVVLRLLKPQPATIEAFVDIVAVILGRMRKYDARALNDVVQTLVDLFEALSVPGLKPVEGLYGELLVMHQATNVDLAAAAWHATAGDRYDYSLDGCRVEVKTTCGPRQHVFSYDQLRAVKGLRLVVASIIVDPDPNGDSVSELLDRVVARITDATTAHRVIRQAMKTLGKQWATAGTHRFDFKSAAKNLRFYSADDVPCIGAPPLGISEIRFKIDLQLLPGSSRAKLHKHGALAKALIA